MTTQKLGKKLNSQKGESLTETLVALLISAVALVMLAGAITAAGHVVTRSKDKLDAYYLNNEDLVKRNAGGNITTSTGNMTITGSDISIPSYAVTFYNNGEFGKYPVVAYKK